MAEFDPNQEFDPSQEFDPYGYYSPEQIAMVVKASKRKQTPKEKASFLATVSPTRKPIIPDQGIQKYMNTLEFKKDIEQKPLAKLGFEGVDRGQARVYHEPFDTNIWGEYKHKKQSLSDDEISTLMAGNWVESKIPGVRPITMNKVERDTFEKMGSSSGKSWRDSISVSNKGHPQNDLRRTATLHHEFGHRAISILRERHGIDVLKITGRTEEELMGIIGFMSSPDWGIMKALRENAEGGQEGEDDEIKEWRNDARNKLIQFEKDSKDPKILAGIVQLQKMAMEVMLEHAKKIKGQKPDDGLGYSAEQEAQMKKEGR
jgi:hypothetical protein